MDLSHLKSIAAAQCVACHMYQDRGGQWHWEAEDALAAVVKQSNGGFDERDDCLADALRHGQVRPVTPLVF